MFSLAAGLWGLQTGGHDLPDYSTGFSTGFISTPKTGFSPTSATKLGSNHAGQRALGATGTFLYSLFALVEGVGLIFRMPWAGWLAIGESAFFIPD